MILACKTITHDSSKTECNMYGELRFRALCSKATIAVNVHLLVCIFAALN